MRSFLLKLFGKPKADRSQGAESLERNRSTTWRGSGRRDLPNELDTAHADYIPLPQSPPTWEVDGREEFHREYTDPQLAPIFQSEFQGQNTKVVKLAAALSEKQRQGRVGELIAKASRKLILRRIKAGQLVAAAVAAAKQSLQMFELVPKYVQDLDRRRFNRILKNIDTAGKKHGFKPVRVDAKSSQPLFSIAGGSCWFLEGERKLKTDERPDPAFEVVAIDQSGTLLLDRSGKSVDQPRVRSILRRLDRNGHVIAEKHLFHDVYRTGSRAAGFIAIMDSGGILHIYDSALNIVLESNLRNDSRVIEHFRTINTNYWGEFKSQVRAVDVGPNGERYLFTLADEAWCCTMTGRTSWGFVMPLKVGWKRVVKRTDRFCVGSEIDEALRLFGLSLPISPVEIKQRYRSLAFTYHPDLNPDFPNAEEHMKALNNAFEVLTGVDPNTLEFSDSEMTHFVRTSPDHVIEMQGMRMEITLTGEIPQDWIYAASFANNGGVYVATYSGRVVRLSPEGQSQFIYDIGTCPYEIVDFGRFSYFLTPTRLYVIEDGTKLAAFLDVFQQGRLIFSQSGFGLLTSKKLQWFTGSGTKLGEVTTRDPIRAIHATEGGTVIQTRQHQVVVGGFRV